MKEEIMLEIHEPVRRTSILFNSNYISNILFSY